MVGVVIFICLSELRRPLAELALASSAACQATHNKAARAHPSDHFILAAFVCSPISRPEDLPKAPKPFQLLAGHAR